VQVPATVMEYVNVEIVGSMSRLLDASAQAGDADHLAARHHCNDSLIEIIFFFMSPHLSKCRCRGYGDIYQLCS
jgi:hypothetical protein